jgi:hypothetical protein
MEDNLYRSLRMPPKTLHLKNRQITLTASEFCEQAVGDG